MSKMLARRFPVSTATFALLALLAALMLPLGAKAAPQATAIAPLVDEATIAVVRLNVAPIDLEAFLAWTKDQAKAMSLPQKDIDQAVEKSRTQGAAVNKWIGEFNKAGGKTIYAMVGMGSPPTVRLAVPLGPGADAKALGKMLAPPKTEPGAASPGTRPANNLLDMEVIPDAKAEVIGKMLYIASPPVMSTLKDFTPAARPELEAAFTACGNAQIAIAINPNEGLRGMAVMAMPQLPKDIGGGPTAILSQGLRWLALTYDLPPKPALHLTIQAKDSTAAGKLHDIVDNIFKSLKEESAGKVPGLDKSLETVTPAVVGDQLHLDLDNQKMLSLAKAFGPAIVKARESAMRGQSMNNLRQIANGTIMYATDNSGKLPLNPKQDLKKYLGPAADTLWVNPSYPDKEGYYYVRPAEKITAVQAPSETLMYYEAFGTFQEGIFVAFADGHVDAVKDEAAFKKMLAKAQGKH